jgi:hypothetical protein
MTKLSPLLARTRYYSYTYVNALLESYFFYEIKRFDI